MLIVFLFLLPLSAAQSGNQFFQLFSGYVGVPITNGQQFILRVLAPFVFIFAISRFVAKGAFKQALDNSGLGGSVGKRAPTLIGLAVAGIMMILFGSVILWVIVIFAIMGALWFLIAGTGYAARSSGASGAIKSAASRVSRSSSSGSDSGGVSADEVEDMIGTKVDELKSEMSEIDGEEQDEKEKEDQTEREEEEGASPGQVEDEIEHEEAELADIVSKLEDVEQGLKSIEDDVEAFEEEELSELREESQDLDNVKQFEDRFLDQIRHVYKSAQNGGLTPEEFEEVQEHVQDQLNYLQTFRNDLEQEHQVHQATEALINELQALKNKIVPHTEEEIQKAETLTEELEDEEKKAETLTQKYGSRDIFEDLQADENETADIEREIRNTVVERMQALEGRLQDQIDRLQEIRQYDEQDWSEIVEIVQELDTVEQDSGRLAGILNRNQSDEFMSKISEMNEHIERIEEMARQLSSEHEA